MDENNKGSGGKLDGFFNGKGFYIVLFLCAAVIGVSAWSLLSGNRTVQKDDIGDISLSATAAPTPAAVTPAPTPAATPEAGETEWQVPEDAVEVIAEPQPEPPEVAAEEPSEQPAVQEEPAQEEMGPAAYGWPLSGEVDVGYIMDTLAYDRTMGDWRTHDGLDILAPLGEPVKAAASGTVTEVYDDGLYGTTVVIDHGAGIVSVYSNLAELPTVVAGDSVSLGDTIGSVGTTAICETNSPYHLHFAMRVNGESVDPTAYLPVR